MSILCAGILLPVLLLYLEASGVRRPAVPRRRRHGQRRHRQRYRRTPRELTGRTARHRPTARGRARDRPYPRPPRNTLVRPYANDSRTKRDHRPSPVRRRQSGLLIALLGPFPSGPSTMEVGILGGEVWRLRLDSGRPSAATMFRSVRIQNRSSCTRSATPSRLMPATTTSSRYSLRVSSSVLRLAPSADVADQQTRRTPAAQLHCDPYGACGVRGRKERIRRILRSRRWVRGSPRDDTRFRCGDPGDEVGDRGDQDRGPKSECHGGVRTPLVSEDGETDEVDHR